MNLFRWILNFLFPERSTVPPAPLITSESIPELIHIPQITIDRINNLSMALIDDNHLRRLEEMINQPIIDIPPVNERSHLILDSYTRNGLLPPELREALQRHEDPHYNWEEILRRSEAQNHEETGANDANNEFDDDVFNESFNHPQPTTQPQSAPPEPGINSEKLEKIQKLLTANSTEYVELQQPIDGNGIEMMAPGM